MGPASPALRHHLGGEDSAEANAFPSTITRRVEEILFLMASPRPTMQSDAISAVAAASPKRIFRFTGVPPSTDSPGRSAGPSPRVAHPFPNHLRRLPPLVGSRGTAGWGRAPPAPFWVA